MRPPVLLLRAITVSAFMGAALAGCDSAITGTSTSSDESTPTIDEGFYGSDTTGRYTYRINKSSGAPMGALGPALREFRGTTDLAFDPDTNTLYGAQQPESGDSRLVQIDTGTGAGTAIGNMGFLGATGLAFDPVNDRLYAIERGDDLPQNLFVIDPDTAAATPVGEMGVDGLTYDPNTGRLYGNDQYLEQLKWYDPSTKAFENVQAMEFTDVERLAYDLETDTLYGTDIDTDQLITINRVSGVGTPVGPLGFDVDNGTLFGADAETQFYLLINPDTGQAAPLDDMIAAFKGFAYYH